MKKIILIIVLFILLLTVAYAQSSYSNYNGKKWEQLSGNGKLVSMQPTVTPFSIVVLNHINVKVAIEASTNVSSLNISIDENLKDFFKVQQSGDTLNLYMDITGGKYSRWISSSNTAISIKTPNLTTLINKGNSTVAIAGIAQKTFTLLNEGNAKITVAGNANLFTLNSLSNCTVNAKDFLTNKTILSSAGNAKIDVNAKELVEANMQGNNTVMNVQNPVVQTRAAATEDNYTDKEDANVITIKLKNNSLLPKKITLISYSANETGNGTRGIVLLPQATRTVKFAVGTKLYLADKEQVQTVMSGASITNQTAFLTVKEADNNKTFKIN
jgi:hypothetical protein